MADKLVSYKGRNYLEMWSGATKYGTRAKLSFQDGTKEFWVDAALVGPPLVADADRGRAKRGRGRKSCHVCGRRHRFEPCGYPGCNPMYCDECDGGGRYCHG